MMRVLQAAHEMREFMGHPGGQQAQRDLVEGDGGQNIHGGDPVLVVPFSIADK